MQTAKITRILELGSGVGFLGPLLRRVLSRCPPEGLPRDEGPLRAPSLSVEIYLTDTDTRALRLCDKTQRLDEALIRGAPQGGHLSDRGREEPATCLSSLASDEATTPKGRCPGDLHNFLGRITVRRLDWQHGGPWAPDLCKVFPAAATRRHAEALGALRVSKAQGETSGKPLRSSGGGPPKNPFEWTQEETDVLTTEGALDLIVASDVLYDFDGNTSLARLLWILLQKNPHCRCFIGHTRRLGIVCPTSSFPVDVFAEDFWDRFCEPDPEPRDADPDPDFDSSHNRKEEPGVTPAFKVYIHPKPPALLVFGGLADPAAAERPSRLLTGSLKDLRAPQGNSDESEVANTVPKGIGEAIFAQTPSEIVEAMPFTEVWELRLNRDSSALVVGE